MASENNHHDNGVHQISQVAVVMVPLPAQGHINQLLHLSRLISAYNFPVHYIGTSTLIRQAQSRAQGLDPSSTPNKIQFHDFPTPSFPNPPPDPHAQIRFPTHMIPSFMAATHLRDPFNEFLKQLSAKHKRVVVIYDYFMSYVVQDTGSVPNAEAYSFRCGSAYTMLCFEIDYEQGNSKQATFPPEIAEFLKETPSADGCVPPEFYEYWGMQRGAKNVASGEILDSNRGMEDAFFGLFAKQVGIGGDKVWGLGPFNPVSVERNSQRHKCLDWLDKQRPNSVIYVSFGSTSSLSDEEIQAIAFGLERSEQKFIWVLREADRANIFEGDGNGRKLDGFLPERFEERVKERGIIVRDWAPQLEILAHPATGGFLSHCGWNSCMESISMGVPIVAWPMHSDQPRNAAFLSKVVKIGIEIVKWERRRQGEAVSGEAVEAAVRKMMESEEGTEMRRRAKELGNGVRKSVLEGGATRQEMDSFIAQVTR